VNIWADGWYSPHDCMVPEESVVDFAEAVVVAAAAVAAAVVGVIRVACANQSLLGGSGSAPASFATLPHFLL
jgi:hypothetical protein